MQMCARCKKRVAVIFITRIENNEPFNEGICLKCARDLGIKPVINDILDKMGLSEADFERLSADMENFMGGLPAVPDEDLEEGGAPAIDFPKLLRESGLVGQPSKDWQKENNEQEKQQKAPKRKYLSTYCKNITRQAADGQLDRIVGRERELARVIQILCRRQKNNPCLLGEPGVGKTAIAEALAQKIVAGDVPYKLRDKEIYLVDLAALVAGTQFRGQFETRILGLLAEVKEAGNIILVIDEVHNIVGAGDAEGSMNAANIMKPALSRGEIQVIGATTLTEYRKYIEKDSALERRFQPVIVNEPSISECIEMLRGIKQYYEDFHGIRIPDNILRAAVLLSERYITDRYLPDKAIDLLDEAAAHVALNRREINEVHRLRDELLKLRAEKEACDALPDATQSEQENKYRRLADIKVRELQLSQALTEVEPKALEVELTHADLAAVIEIWTGVPASSITENEFVRLHGLEERLKQRIIGQDEAVSAVARAIRRNRAGVSYKRKPVSFIFAGPTGVGKTELVKVLSEDLFDTPETLIRLDMSEFMEKHSVSRIIGAPPGYVGYDEAGQLTEKVRRRPYSVILFDEIEKAHPDVLNILLQILDDGKITDARGKEVNFENTLIVMTTNAGSQRSSGITGFSESLDIQEKEKTERALGEFLRPEFLNRVDEIITFRTLNMDDFGAIANLMLKQLAEVLREKGITFSFTPEAAAKIAADAYSVKYGARNMRRYIQLHVEDQLAQLIIGNYDRPVNSYALIVEDNALKIVAV